MCVCVCKLLNRFRSSLPYSLSKHSADQLCFFFVKTKTLHSKLLLIDLNTFSLPDK